MSSFDSKLRRLALILVVALGSALWAIAASPAAAQHSTALQANPLSQSASATNNRNRRAQGQAGGAGQADFDTLIDLIQSTIAPESWVDVGGEGAIDAFPGGVYVDSQGLLQTLDEPTRKRLAPHWQQLAASQFRRLKQRDVGRPSRLRAVSLTQLLDACRQLDATDSNTESMRYLAGLYRIDFFVVDSDRSDVWIAGPAGPWTINRAGRRVNAHTGRPVLRLDDLIVLLANAVDNQGHYLCAITPTREGLAQAQSFAQRQQPLRPGQRDRWLEAFRSALGPQRVDVQGIDSASRVARVIVEADYHMKQIGIGRVVVNDSEGKPLVVNYLDRLAETNTVPERMDVLRWWFTLHPDAVRTVESQQCYEFGSQAVQVLSENELLTRTGDRIHTGESNPLNEAFAEDFTRSFNALATQFPIYADLDNVFRLSIVAALIDHVNARQRCQWDIAAHLESSQYAMPTGRAPQWIQSIVNHRMVNQRVFLAAVSGGVRFDGSQIVRMTTRDLPNSSEPALPLHAAADSGHWWWDLALR